ncbi:ABC transporter ATP-binding protein [Bacillus horti]|uniref:Hydroxymethylpyrimidine transport system ATP-binding protein n=1 Tax=Caldalkalibacillus horti TaxID=77523 RepID=A0ABT9VZG8_9BACI|nr:ABC transporter ATP-binding protein [Bacillus horti]MDQ0166005.1 putative hydroxymethylpyrimidine transport system ATP-binding protein [Bacillus horti]
MSKPVLQFEHVDFSYEGVVESQGHLLDSLSLSIEKGEFVSIIGPSGSGKTTLFRLISGLEQPSQGQILMVGQWKKDRLGQVGYMPQQDLLLPWRTILENSCLPLELKGVSKEEAKRKVLDLLDEFGLAGTEHRYPTELSGGMRQRVSFLRSVLSGSPILLLDEPFSALDAITRLSMQEWLIQQWERWGKTILFITHDVDEALFLSDRILVCTQKPIKELQEVQVPLDRPRTLRDLNQGQVIALKELLIQQLRGNGQ